MRFERISSAQLYDLEKELIAFLIVQGIDGDAWAKLNLESPTKAEELVDVFSDLIWDKVLSEMKCLERKTQSDWSLCRMGDTDGEMFIVKMKDHKPWPEPVTFENLEWSQIEAIQGKKKYKKDRVEEIYDLVKCGYNPCDENEYEVLKSKINV